MRIKAINARWLRVPIPEDRQHTSDFGRHTSFDTALVRMETECGLIGYGEAKAAVGGTGVYRALIGIIENDVAPAVIGEDPRDPSRLWERMYNGSRRDYALERGRVFPDLARRGLTVCAISGIDIAAWDILGQHLGVPVWRLLGGRTHAWLPAYASGGWAPEEEIGDQLASYTEHGFASVKMRVGIQDGDVDTSVRRVQAARRRLGPEIGIMVDAHGTFGAREAIRFARKVEECDLAWFEEPISPDDLVAQTELRARTDVPIAAGESLFTRFDFRDVIAARAVDVLQPDPAICGGITEARRIGVLAETHQLGLAPHLWGGAVMFAAGLHVAIASPAAFILEYSLAHNPMQHELAQQMFPVVDGGIAAPESSGLGVTVNEQFVECYAV